MFGVALLTSTLLALADARIYERCELARDLLDLGIRKEHIATWVCIAYHESRFDTAARNPHSGDHGLLQISELYWCGPGKACGQPCTAFRDEDITNDVECALQIHEEHTRLQGDGFMAWVVYPHHCKHNAKKYLADCDSSVKTSSVRTAGRARVIKPHIRNFTNNYAYYDKIDELLPPYLTVGSLVRGGYEKQFQQTFNKKPQVYWLNYKLDNIDELKLPVFGSNFKQKISEKYSTTTFSTTTTTTPSPLPNIKPPSPRRIESNSFRRRKNRPIPGPEVDLSQSTEIPYNFVKSYVIQKNIGQSTIIAPLTTIRPSTTNIEKFTSYVSGTTQTTKSPTLQTTTRIQTTTRPPSFPNTTRTQTTRSSSVQTTTRIKTTTKTPSVQTTTRIQATTRPPFVQSTTKISTTPRQEAPRSIQTTTKIPSTTASPSVQTTTRIPVTTTTSSVQTTRRIPTTTRPVSDQATMRIPTTTRPHSDQISTRIATTSSIQTTTRSPTTITKVVATKQPIDITKTRKVNKATSPVIEDISNGSYTDWVTPKSTRVPSSLSRGKPTNQLQISQKPRIAVTEETPITLKPLTTASYYKYSFTSQVNKSQNIHQSTTTTTSKPQPILWATWRTSRGFQSTRMTTTTTTTSKPSIINWRNSKSGSSESQETLKKNSSTTKVTDLPKIDTPKSTTVWPKPRSIALTGSNTSTTNALFVQSTTMKPKVTTARATSPIVTKIVTSTQPPPPSTARTTQSIFDLYLNPTKRPKPPMFSFQPFKSSGHSFKIFAGGTTTNAPFFRKKDDPKTAPGEAAKNQIKRQAW